MGPRILKDGTVICFNEAKQRVEVLPRASILIADGRIAAIAEAAKDLPLSSYDDVEEINLNGKIVSPGFVNTHAHSWQSVYRTIGPNVVLANYFEWLSQMSPTATRAFTPDDVYIACLSSYLEGINSGVTSYVEHASANWSEKVLQAGHDASVDSKARVWWCYDLAGRDDFPAALQWEKLGGIAAKTSSQSLVQLGLALDSLAGSSQDLGKVRDSVGSLKLSALTLHHMGGPWPQAQTGPSEICKQDLHQTGAPIIFSHSPYLESADIESLRQHDLYVSITPESECQYGHGQTTGSIVSDKSSLGLDTNWTFSGDMIAQARLWLQVVRNDSYRQTLASGRIPNANPMAVEQAFLLATRQGGRALRRNDIGVLQVGAKADIVVFNGDSPNMLGWSDPVAAVVLHANAGDAEHVLVDGSFRKRDFKLVEDGAWGTWQSIRAKFLEAAKRIQSQVKEPPPMPEMLWGVGKMGDVEIASTIRSNHL